MPKKKKVAKKKAPAKKGRGSYAAPKGIRRGGKASGMKGRTGTRKKRR